MHSHTLIDSASEIHAIQVDKGAVQCYLAVGTISRGMLFILSHLWDITPSLLEAPLFY